MFLSWVPSWGMAIRVFNPLKPCPQTFRRFQREVQPLVNGPLHHRVNLPCSVAQKCPSSFKRDDIPSRGEAQKSPQEIRSLEVGEVYQRQNHDRSFRAIRARMRAAIEN